jgi:hypothetical protein
MQPVNYLLPVTSALQYTVESIYITSRYFFVLMLKGFLNVILQGLHFPTVNISDPCCELRLRRSVYKFI